jgi:hypothetical protein
MMTTVLSAGQVALLTTVLNTLIPAKDGLLAAGDLGLAGRVDAALAASPGVRRFYLDGLLAIEAAGDRPFGELDGEAQEAALRAVEAAHPVFFAALVEHAYRFYYTDPRVQRAVGMTDGPPQPRGYQLPVFDEQLLTIQRKRESFWRRVP